MELYLDRIFNKNELTRKTINYYNRYFFDNQIAFEETFGVPFKLFFGNVDCLNILYRLLNKYYRNEFFVKYFFISKVLFNTDDVYFYELPVNNSRADVVSINKNSTVFEIKTEYDNLDRLKKQMDDYSLCFDYLYLVCDEKKVIDAIELIPEYTGIYCFDDHSSKLKIIRKARINKNIDPRAQLKMLALKDLEKEFNSIDIEYILDNYSTNKINSAFKRVNFKKHLEACGIIKKECSILMNIH